MHTHLSGKERIKRVFSNQLADHVPWVVFAGIHAGLLKGYGSIEYLQDAEKIIECLKEVNKTYMPDGQPILFDLQIEAEILGCEVKWIDKAPPVVVSHPLANSLEIPTQSLNKTDGRIPIAIQVMKEMKEFVKDETALFGLVTGPLTLASHLRGTGLFMDLMRNKEFATQLLEYCTEIAIQMIDFYIEAGMDVIAIVDPVVSQVSPRTYAKFLEKPFYAIFEHIRAQDRLSAFFVCGDATKNIEPMCKTKPDSIFIDENIDMAEAKKITDQYNIAIGGNIPLTTVMLYGTQQDNMQYVLDLMDRLDPHNLIIAPGCDMPYDTPPDNVVGVAQAVKEPESVRKILENYTKIDENIEVELPDYDNLTKPLIEIFTIDSDVCAACGYMKNMAFTAVEKYGDRIEIVEWKATLRESIARATLLGLKHLPCLLINGKIKYSSIIPTQEEYFMEIDKYLK